MDSAEPVESAFPQFAAVPFPLLNAFRARKLKANDLIVYLMLDAYRNRKTGECWPGLRCLCEDAGLGITTIRKALGRLRESGFLTIRNSGVFHHPQIYKLLYAPGFTPPTGWVRLSKSDTLQSATSSATSSIPSLSTQPEKPDHPPRTHDPNPKKDSDHEGARCAPRALVSLGLGARP